MAREAPDYGNGRGNPGATEVIEEAQRGADSSLADALSPQLALDTGDERVQKQAPGLSDKFIVPPFSVLDTRQGYWRERRDAWLSLGLRSELGRKGALLMNSGVNGDPKFYTRKAEVEARLGRAITTAEFREQHYNRDEALAGTSASMLTGTSVFDPVLCEVAYRWFSAAGHVVLDPFAGGAVRGVLAGVLGREYVGVELRAEQVADNRAQADSLIAGDLNFGRRPVRPVWIEGDATRITEYGLDSVDMVFTCPPYADLERYSDDPRDLSTMPYEQFREALHSAIRQGADALKPDRFAVWVVGEVRGKDGLSRGLIHDTITGARTAGMALYNEAILLGSVGTAMLRAAKHVTASRKLERVHQHVLVFVKGDPKRAAAACGSAEIEA